MIDLVKLKELFAEYDQVEGSYPESEFEGKSVFSFIENRIKDNSEWSDEYPAEEGFYWFFGEPFMGSMGGHFKGTIKPNIELNIVKMHFVGKKLLGQDRGQILYPHKWDGIKAGWMGKWRKMELPFLPSIESIK